VRKHPKAYKEFHPCIYMSKGHCGRITRADYAKGKGKNPCGKTVKVDTPMRFTVMKPQALNGEY